MIVMVNGDPAHRRLTGDMLAAAGRASVEAADGRAALALLTGGRGGDISLALIDLTPPDMSGLDVLKRIRAVRPALPVVVLSAIGSVANAVEAMRAGADDFLVRPVSADRLESAIRAALASSTTAAAPSAPIETRARGFAGLIAESAAVHRAIAEAERAARSDIPVLIEGESGVGKEVFARAIHASSDRADAAFVAVNCGALPGALIESILFGHEKGAFTGAVARRIGKFEEANGGALFLDEIGELPLDAQVKLLRAIQEGEIDPVGGAATVTTDIRLISATNRDLAAEVEAGRFREDLFYRIGVFALTLPPLRERREDIAPLAARFAAQFAARERKPAPGLTEAAAALLTASPWPGNVRQLENAVYRAVVMGDGDKLGAEDFAHIGPAAASAEDDGARSPFFDRAGHIRPLAEIEGAAVEAALLRYGGSMSEAARRLEIGRSTLYRKTREGAASDPATQEGSPAEKMAGDRAEDQRLASEKPLVETSAPDAATNEAKPDHASALPA